MEVPSEQIRDLAHQSKNSDQEWHYHFLTPDCLLNESDRYALVLEVPGQVYTHHSSEAERELSKELSELLHGSDVVNDTGEEDKIYEPSEVVKAMVKKATELAARGIEWHHHVLFPSCQFNKNKPKFTLVVEDPEKKEILESISDSEPSNDLRQIEKLFYSQK